MQIMIEGLLEKLAQNAFEVSEHAVAQCIIRGIEFQEICEAISVGEVIEDYPEDKYGPSLLLLGFTIAQRPLHIQCSYPSRPLVKIITAYEPDPNRWIDYRLRRQTHE